AESEQALLQQQKDRETKAAFEVLEGGRRRKQGSSNSSSQSTPSTSASSVEKSHNNNGTHSQTNNVQTTRPAEKLIVLKRYRLWGLPVLARQPSLRNFRRSYTSEGRKGC